MNISRRNFIGRSAAAVAAGMVAPSLLDGFHGSWRMFWDYGGGLLTDWGVHLLDMALWGMDMGEMPNRVFASGGNFAYPDNIAETFGTLSVIYEFDDFTIQWNNIAGTETGPYGRNYGLAFKGTNGTLIANREGWEVIPDQDKVEPVSAQPDYEDHKKHVAQFVDYIKRRTWILHAPSVAVAFVRNTPISGISRRVCNRNWCMTMRRKNSTIRPLMN